MNSIKHFSFDLWLTLIKSNPIFKEKRALYFYENYNTKGRNLEFVESVFRRIDLMCNAINEKTGGNIHSEEMYLMVINEINNSNNLFDSIDLSLIYNQLEGLFLQHAPTVFDSHTIDTLEIIYQKPDTTISVLSNTAFIKGKTLRKLLNQLNMSHFFSFQIYSDEINASKPNPIVFEYLLKEVNIIRKESPLKHSDIIHIGDNIVADIQGARSVGINSLLINSNGKSIQSVYK